MNIIYRMLYIQLLISCVSITASAQMSLLDPIINQEDGRKLVEQLSADSLKGRVSGSKGQ